MAAVADALASLGVGALVMGGHAARFYGVDRNTIDYDFCLALDADTWARLADVLARSAVIAGPAFREEHSWRPRSFRRFVIGHLTTGQEERLELWRRNHLLAPFDELHARRAEGVYGGRLLTFLGLDDLIRSKETEREDDWRDVALLEEIADDRRFAAAASAHDRVVALARLRSRRGFERAWSAGWFDDRAVLAGAFSGARNAMARAYVLPSAMRAGVAPLDPSPALRVDDQLRGVHGEIGQTVDAVRSGGEDDFSVGLCAALRNAVPASARHLALVEAARRLYRRACMAADRADKERELKNPG